MTDRFQDGDPTNDPPAAPQRRPARAVPGRRPRRHHRADQRRHLRSRSAFARSGSRRSSPAPGRLSRRPTACTSRPGYHGYWPTKAREVDPRIGGDGGASRDRSPPRTRTGSASSKTSWWPTSTRSTSTSPRIPTGSSPTECVCGSAADCDWTAQRSPANSMSICRGLTGRTRLSSSSGWRTRCGGSTRSTSTASGSTR